MRKLKPALAGIADVMEFEANTDGLLLMILLLDAPSCLHPN